MNPIKFQENDDKFRELILYIAERSVDDPTFGATKLNKLLWAADMAAHRELGHPITGVKYVKEVLGPVPERLVYIRDSMIEDGDLCIQLVDRFGKVQKRPIHRRKAKLAEFTAEEISITDRMIQSFWRVDASGMTTWSHEHLGWQIVGYREEIPYHTIFLCDRPPTQYEIERGLALADKLGWNV
jgi:hypothetical protein